MKTLLDLKLGNPLFLKPYWDDISDEDPNLPIYISYPNENIAYGFDGGSQELIEEIKALHIALGNANIKDKHIVVGCGATQMVGAVLKSVPGYGVTYQPPYYLKFDQIVQYAGQEKLPLSNSSVWQPEIEIVTSPSNPMNERNLPWSNSPTLIYDLCYNWPQYGKTEYADYDIMIFSMSKSTGHAGSRVGWAILKDPELAKRVAYATEITSGGASRDAQERAKHILRYERERIQTNVGGIGGTVFEYGLVTLTQRWNRINRLNNPMFRPINSSGMFLLAEYGPPGETTDAKAALLSDHNIDTHSGTLIGVGPNQLRVNIGCSQEDFDRFIERLQK